MHDYLSLCMMIQPINESSLILFDVSNEEKFSDNSYIRCFASVSEPETLSDFLIAAEDAKTKMLMHMSGKIKVK